MMRSRPSRLSRTRHDDGAVTPFAVIVMFSLFLVVGLVHDGGQLLAERREAAAAASGAARAAAQGIDESAALTGVVTLDGTVAAEHVAIYLSDVGMEGEIVGFDGSSVTVEVRSSVDMDFLDLIGIGSRDISARASARATPGILQGDLQ